MRKILRHFGLLAVCSLLAACGLRIPDPAPYVANCTTFTHPAPSGTVGGIFFVTSRLADCREDRLQFAGYRDPQVRFGISNLPADGEEPWKRHESMLHDSDGWQAALQRSLAAGDNDGRLLVYVHGYFNNFEDALHRASNLRDLDRRGVPTVVFSWPSRNERTAYAYDEDSIAWAQDQLDDLLLRLSVISADITIVSHSMGARAVLGAVERLDLADPGKGRSVRRIVLASPDIDRDQALRPRGILERLLRQPDRRILAYVSKDDVAIALSQAVHGYSRLGSSDCEYDVTFARRRPVEAGNCHLAIPHERLALVDTSEASAATAAGHHDFVETCAARADLTAFLRGRQITWRERVERPGESLVGYRIMPNLIGDEVMQEVCPS